MRNASGQQGESELPWKKSDKEHKHDNIFGEHIRQFFPKSNFLPS